jgi:hypothetical protein
MSAMGRQDLAFDDAGIFATVVATAVAALGIVRIISPLPAPSPQLLLLALAVVIAAIFMLCRFQVPNAIRAGLTLSLITILLILTATGDLFGVRGAQADVSASLTGERPAGPESIALDPGQSQEKRIEPSAVTGARIRLEPDINGDGGWAHMINEAASGRLGGSDAILLTVAGSVALTTLDAQDRLAVTWSIETDGKSTRCGTTTLLNLNKAMVVDQISASFRRAIEQSIRTNAPACF